MIYLAILFLLIILAIRYDVQGKTKYRDEWYMSILLLLILVAGLRWRFACDTVRYMHAFYYETPQIWDLTAEGFLKSGKPPLWILLNSIVKTLGGKFFVVQLIQAAIVDILFFKFFRKHSPYPFACVVLFFFWRYQYFNMQIMKAAVALSIIMYANDYMLEKKYKKWFLLIIIATGFHQSSVLMLITPFMLFLRLNRLGFFLLGFTYFVGMLLQSMLGDFLEMLEFAEGLSNRLEGHVENGTMAQTQNNINYYLFSIFPLLFYVVLSFMYVKLKCNEAKLLQFEPFIMMGFLMQMIQLNIHIFYRFTYIYHVYYIIFLVQFYMEYSRRSLRLSRCLAYTRSFIILIPFVACLLNANQQFTTINYNPYYTVIDRSTDRDRERYYKTVDDFPTFHKNEY